MFPHCLALLSFCLLVVTVILLQINDDDDDEDMSEKQITHKACLFMKY